MAIPYAIHYTTRGSSSRHQHIRMVCSPASYLNLIGLFTKSQGRLIQCHSGGCCVLWPPSTIQGLRFCWPRTYARTLHKMQGEPRTNENAWWSYGRWVHSIKTIIKYSSRDPTPTATRSRFEDVPIHTRIETPQTHYMYSTIPCAGSSLSSTRHKMSRNLYTQEETRTLFDTLWQGWWRLSRASRKQFEEDVSG